jgi:hypothetical protein
MNTKFGISESESFSEKILTQESLDWIEEESSRIAAGVIEGNVSRNSLGGNYRTHEQIKSDARNGLIAEAYLIQEYNYTDNPKRFHDVITPEGIEVEVKTYSGNNLATRYNQILRLESRKTKYEHVIMFKRQDGIYTFDSYWTYNKDTRLYEEVK